ncbi:ABC transporter ATP-binding protein [Arcanobacterium hippocoleae]|uniref:Peptide/nickel transport system ATP-binding protein n=1 Tax=Arcanobacterium hippocoleae TaxID=149017 RepID=A0ABU1T0K7_9ACTO|nr:ABC transporter ATP-binding protein [Arcanobacterium hippocoleae]MDR6938863.1 peptide/nickel transport system ATP-binding protein [Arcanobacterium hippocoleae]
MKPILSVRDLQVSFPSEAGRVDAVRGVSFDLEPGKTLGIVGESGSGKSVTSLAIMGLLPEYAAVSGSVKFAGEELVGMTDAQMAKLRGAGIGMIFQDPLSALTPVFDVGTQIVEALQIHNDISKEDAWKRAVELLEIVGIPNAKERVKSFPHEFSGGMRQRVVIAIAIANNPKVLICDEPTTALDVTIQAQILDVIKTAQRETGAAVIMITHDMGVVAGSADEVLVMYAGKPVEQAPIYELFAAPRHPYSVGLLGSIPKVNQREHEALVPIEGNPPIVIDLADECPFISRCPVATAKCRLGEPPLVDVAAEYVSDAAHQSACVLAGQIHNGKIAGKDIFPVPTLSEAKFKDVPREERQTVLEVQNLVKTFPLIKGALLKRRVGSVYAVNDISFDLKEGECLAIVGESGCGKSTTLLEIMDLGAHVTDGVVVLNGENVSTLSKRDRRNMRKDIQMVFQDPMGALDPRLTVKEIIQEPLTAFGQKEGLRERVQELMALVGLDPKHIDRFPGAFSGGQRQRIGLARALATNPKVIVLDEPVSALDVSIQAGMINLLDELKNTLGISYLFVAHDLSVIRHISDRAAVMYLGKFVEVGDTDAIFEDPVHPYTQALLSAIPIPDPEVERNRERLTLEGDLPSPTSNEPGCRFKSRCPLYKSFDGDAKEKCDHQTPLLQVRPNHDHAYACHHR